MRLRIDELQDDYFEDISFMSLNDQLTLLAKQIMELPTGTKFVRNGGIGLQDDESE